MRKVADKNYLQKPELRQFLSATKENMVVLTDYVSMEAYKGDDTLTNIYESMKILSEFPKQVIILKNTLIICGLSGRRNGLQQRLIDKKQTKGFSTYCHDILSAKEGGAIFQQLLGLSHDAVEHLDGRILDDARNFPLCIEDIAKRYHKKELVALREAGSYIKVESLCRKLMEDVLNNALGMFRPHPRVKKLPEITTEMPNTFIFRMALCGYLLALDWILLTGAQGAKRVKETRIRNDMVDASFAAYATYFDGLLSCDDKCCRIHYHARELLSMAFGCHISSLPN